MKSKQLYSKIIIIFIVIGHTLVFLLVLGCHSSAQDTFNRRELVSSKGDKIYINSLNWGITDDNQMSIVSSDANKLRERRDSVDVAHGLEPFIYRFENDTLELIFENRVRYTVKEKFNTITIKYVVLKGTEFSTARQKAYKNDRYYSVPARTLKNYPSNRPNAPTN